MNFAKMAADMDSHPKVRKAGRDGREVFLFILRRNAIGNHDGQLPLYYADPDYLAEQLMMGVDDARNGMSRAVTAGLLRVTGAELVICGWDFEWSKSALTNSERQARFREKSKQPRTLEPEVTQSNGVAVTANAIVTTVTEDQIRLEEKRSRATEPPVRSPSEASGHQEAIAVFEAKYQAAYGTKPTWGAKQCAQIKRLLKRHGLAEVEKRIRALFDEERAFPRPPYDIGTLEQHFDKLVPSSNSSAKRRVVTGGELDLEDPS